MTQDHNIGAQGPMERVRRIQTSSTIRSWSRGQPSVQLAAVLGAAVLLVLVGVVFFSSAGSDDSHITYWPAYTLSHYGAILNYNGERVEQSSSLLNVLLLALCEKLTGFPITDLGKVLSVLFGVASVVAVSFLARRIQPKTAFPAALLTATSAYFVYWAFGGLEATLVCFTLICVVIAYSDFLASPLSNRKVLFYPVAATVPFLLVRPESPIVLICGLFGVGLVVFLKRQVLRGDGLEDPDQLLPRLAILLGICVLCAAILFLVRGWYFGSILPQPVSAKSSGLSWSSVNQGIQYFRAQLLQSRPIEFLLGLCILGLAYFSWTELRSRNGNPYVLLTLGLGGTYTLSVLFSGGDWMEGGRFLVPVIPIALMFIPLLLLRLSQSWPTWFVVLLLLLGLEGRTLLSFTSDRSTGTPIWSEIRVPDGFDLARFSWFERRNRVNMRDVPTLDYVDGLISRLLILGSDRVVILSGQMGMVPFHIALEHFPRVRFLDRHALVERAFTSCPVTASLPRTQLGLDVTYESYFQARDSLERECGVARPDIIFDVMYKSEATVLETHGFTIVFYQTGFVAREDKWPVGGKNWLPGLAIRARQLVAVRNDLLPRLSSADPVEVDFGGDP